MSRSKTKQKKSSAGKNVAIFFIVFVLLEALIIFGLYKVFEDENNVVEIFGYSFFIMDSENMGEDIPKNALVIADGTTPSPSNAVLCKNVEGQGTTVAWLYEVGSKGDTVDGIVYTVYQESAPDKMYDLRSEDIVGIATSYYSTAGEIISFVITPFGMAICVAAPIVLLILIELIIAIARRPVYEDEYEDEDDYAGNDTDNVTLDDFLYGGENDNIYTSTKPKESYEEEFEDKYASMMNRTPVTVPANTEPDPVEELVFEQPESEEPSDEESAPEQPETQPAPDEALAAVEETAAEAEENTEPAPEQTPAAKPEAQRRPAQKRPANGQRRPRPSAAQKRPASAPRRNANEALEELMKMMEEEQKKLKESSKE